MEIIEASWFFYIRDGIKYIRFKDLAQYAILEGSNPEEAINDIVKNFNCRKKAGIAGFNTREDAQSIIDWVESYLIMDKLVE